MSKNTRAPSLRLVASSVEAPRNCTIYERALGYLSATPIGTFCRSARSIIGSVVMVSLFMLALLSLFATTALKGIWSGLSKGVLELRSARANKVDENQPQLVDDLRALGISVQPLGAVGDGCPDLLIGAFGHNLLLEVKDPGKPKSRRKLTPEQVKFHNNWRGQKAVVETLEDVLREVSRIRKR